MKRDRIGQYKQHFWIPLKILYLYNPKNENQNFIQQAGF